jgi:hypothetical protein
MKYIYHCSGWLATALSLEGQSAPTFSLSLLPPTLPPVSWPGNFASWQLAGVSWSFVPTP